MKKHAPQTHIFIIAVFVSLGLEAWISSYPSDTTTLLFLRTTQSLFCIAWLHYCRQLTWFGLGLPNAHALITFGKYALICGSTGILCLLFWPDLNSSLQIPPIAEGMLGLSLFILAGPIFEELFFRALLYRFLQTVMPTSLAILVSASMFAFMHGAWLSPQLIGGIIFALAYEQSKSLWVAIALHAAANAAIVIAALYI